MAKRPNKRTSEIDAIGKVSAALDGLDTSAQNRVLKYVAEMLGISLQAEASASDANTEQVLPPIYAPVEARLSDDVEGINTVALKWIRRSDLNPKSLQKFFSLGIDDIDLVAKAVPGNTKKDRMRSVLLLKAIAAYLGTGAPRVTYEQLKEACLHYDAYDATNFAAYLKSFAGDVGGSKKTGFTLTARGLTSATELLKQMLESS